MFNEFPCLLTSRRGFIRGCSSAVAALAASRLGFLGFTHAQAAPADNRETVVVIFLRGGMDGLSLIPPIEGDDRAHYEEARPNIRLPLTGSNAALPLEGIFGLHPSAASLRPFFQDRKLAIVHAVGTSGSRSHFDAMKYLELGTPGDKTTPLGWLTRHLQSSPALPPNIPIPAIATGGTPPTSLQGSLEYVNVVDANTFRLSQIGHASWAWADQWNTLRRLCELGDSFVHTASLQALNAAGLIENYVQGAYSPSGGAVYPPNSQFALHLRLLAQLIKNDVGLRVATVDLPGWDSHENQGVSPGGNFAYLVQQLSDGLAAFYTDLNGSTADAPIHRVTIVVMSEFGRRIRENANAGTDHGTGNPVLILGGNVLGGFHGSWPGLHPDQRFDNADLAPTTDIRQLLSEILIRRTANPRLGEVFPHFQNYAPLNIVRGPDLTPDYTALLPVTPADFSATRLAPNLIQLRWSAAAHASNYRIERRLQPSDPWEHLVIVTAPSSQHHDTTAPADSLPTYRLLAFNSAGDGAFVETSLPATSDPRAQWRLTHFGTTANAGPAADDAIATHDGLSNFVKYALGLDPLAPALTETSGFTPGRPRLEVAGSTVALVYLRPVSRPDVHYEVVASTGLKSWTTQGVEEDTEGTANGFERRRAILTTADPQKHFLKLNVWPV